jgi:hypothetical protein
MPGVLDGPPQRLFNRLRRCSLTHGWPKPPVPGLPHCAIRRLQARQQPLSTESPAPVAAL